MLKCYPTIPVLCKQANNSCGLDIWLNYKNISESKNRIIIKNCYKNECLGCKRTLKNESTLVLWNLVATLQVNNYFVSETYDLIILSNKNDSNLRSYWNKIEFPPIKVTFF